MRTPSICRFGDGNWRSSAEDKELSSGRSQVSDTTKSSSKTTTTTKRSILLIDSLIKFKFAGSRWRRGHKPGLSRAPETGRTYPLSKRVKHSVIRRSPSPRGRETNTLTAKI